MENIYLFFVIALFVLAISDLVVGVGNDAVNFLNSAIGSKVAPFYVILGIAAAGVLFGATFSSGMMEIARRGVFFPDQFYFNEVMIIFLAVMITDIILLDMFNTFGLPTSTTVSIVFELLGAAVAVSLYKIYFTDIPPEAQDIGLYINATRALGIISGILLSVVIAFTAGSIVQFLTRLLFTFNYEKKLPFFGAIWTGIAVSAIVYFILVKGASGSSFMTDQTIAWIENNTVVILLYSFITVAIISQLLITLFKLNIFRVIVLIGTFSLAMAFAGNDLVNFIGVPIAGYESYMMFVNDPSQTATTMTMESLLAPVRTPTGFLLAAGAIMVLALFFSKKARTVSKTEVNLARQSEGYERFSSSLFARTIVRKALDANKAIMKILPGKVVETIDKRFDQALYKRRKRIRKDESSFDILRASVNMFIASILIAFATSMKLPLSTTYVTFMVAMGTSLSDRAWGRESAVYRITGVMTVIAGWFFTAFTAFSVAFIFAYFISWGGITAAVIAILIAFGFVVRTHYLHKKLVAKKNIEEEKAKDKVDVEMNGEDVMGQCKETIVDTVVSVSKLYNSVLSSFLSEDRKTLKKARKRIIEFNSHTKNLKKDVYFTLRKLEEGSVETGHYYVQIIDYLREIAHCLNFIVDPLLEHIENNHKPCIEEQEKELIQLNENVALLYGKILEVIKTDDFNRVENAIQYQIEILEDLDRMKKMQVKLIKKEKVKTRNSLLFFNLLSETKNLLLHTINMLKSHRDFIISHKVNF